MLPRLLRVLVLVLVLLTFLYTPAFPLGIQAIQGLNWAATNPIYDSDGSTLLQNGDCIQLIYVGSNGVADPPNSTTGGAGGDDVIYAASAGNANPNVISKFYIGPFLSSMFSWNSDFASLNVGNNIYLRAWNAPCSPTSSQVCYGTSPLYTLQLALGDTFDATSGGSFSTTNCSPQATTIASFLATGRDSGQIVLTWHTAGEVESEGFHVHRSRDEDGPYGRLTDALIPACGSPTSGCSYEYVDDTVEPDITYYYKLEEVSLYGESTFYGPVAASSIALSHFLYLPVLSR